MMTAAVSTTYLRCGSLLAFALLSCWFGNFSGSRCSCGNRRPPQTLLPAEATCSLPRPKPDRPSLTGWVRTTADRWLPRRLRPCSFLRWPADPLCRPTRRAKKCSRSGGWMPTAAPLSVSPTIPVTPPLRCGWGRSSTSTMMHRPNASPTSPPVTVGPTRGPAARLQPSIPPISTAGTLAHLVSPELRARARRSRQWPPAVCRMAGDAG